MSSRTTQIISIVGLLVASLAWGSSYVVTKSAITDTDPTLIILYRFLPCALILGFYLILKGKAIFSNFRSGLVTGIFFWGLLFFQNIGLVYTSATNSSFLTGNYLIFIPFITYFVTKERPEVNKFFLIFISLIGTWFLTGGISQFNKGDFFSLFSAFAFALYIVVGDYYIRGKNIDPLILSFQQFLVTGVLSLVYLIVRGYQWGGTSTQSLLLIAYLALVPGFIATVVVNVVQTNLQPFTISLILTLTSVFGAVLAWTIGGEQLTLTSLFGSIIIFSAVIIPVIESKINNHHRIVRHSNPKPNSTDSSVTAVTAATKSL